MMTLSRYLARHYLLGCLPVLLALTALFSFLALSEELEDVGQGFFQTGDALLVTLYTTPSRILELLPVTLLLGGLFGLGGLARHHELVVMRAAGLSIAQLLGPIIWVALLAIVLVASLRFHVIPEFELRAMQLRAQTQATEFLEDESSTGYWMRAGDQLLHIGDLVDGHRLTNIEIYQLNAEGRVEHLIRAETGRILAPRDWALFKVSQIDFRQEQPREEKRLHLSWQSRLSDRQTASLTVPIEALSPAALYRYISLLDKNDLDSHRYQVVLWQQISQLLALLIMALLSLPFVLGAQRSGALGRASVIGGGLGIGFYLAEQLMSHLSILLNLAPPFAALVPEALMAFLALGLLVRASKL